MVDLTATKTLSLGFDSLTGIVYISSIIDTLLPLPIEHHGLLLGNSLLTDFTFMIA